MTVDTKKPDSAPDDIDLLLLLERSLLFFKKYRWVFIIAIVTGISAGIFMYSYLPNIYKSRLIVHSFLLTNQEEIQIVANWNELLKKKEYAELAGAFNCPENIFGKLKQIKAEEIQKVFTTTNPHGFIIEAEVTDNAILDDLQKGIVYGFENSEYVKEKLAVKRATLEELIDKTGAEIQKLDSTKRTVENIIEGKGRSSSFLIVDVSSINRQLIEMNEKLLGFRAELKFTKAIQVLQGFSKFRKPVNPKLIPWLVLGLVFFLGLAYILALFSSINEKLKKRSLLKNNT
jgi:hypothetical protein